MMPPDAAPPTPAEIPQGRLTKEQLQPPTPSVFLENKKQAFSPQLQEFCLKHPIAVIRQLAAALKLGEKKSSINLIRKKIFVPYSTRDYF